MIIGLDIGGTKTLLSVFAENGKMLEEIRIETNQDYEIFIQDLTAQARRLNTNKAKIACAAVPGLIDRKRGIAESLGNLPWRNKPIAHDLSEALGVQHVYIENDSKLAGLAEALHLRDEYKRVFYITISTGIGGAWVVNGKLVKEVIDMEIGKAPLQHKGKIQAWEEFASGKAFFKKYEKKAIEVKDPKIWEEFAQDINAGLGIICAAYQPDVIVFGGGLGQRLNRFKEYLGPYLEAHLHPNVRQPKALLATHFRGQSVIYGCYAYAKDKLA